MTSLYISLDPCSVSGSSTGKILSISSSVRNLIGYDTQLLL